MRLGRFIGNTLLSLKKYRSHSNREIEMDNSSRTEMDSAFPRPHEKK